MAQPRKPRALKIVTGTDQPCRREPDPVQLPSLDAVPAAPDWLPNAHAQKEWQRLAPILVTNNLLAAADLAALGHLCAVHGKMVQLWSAGEAPTGHMVAQFNALAAAFGLAPAWRGKVKPVGDKDAGNKFGKFKGPA